MIWTEVFIEGERLRGLAWLSGPWGAREPRSDGSPIMRATTVVKVLPDMPRRPTVFAEADIGTVVRAQVTIYRAGKVAFTGAASVELASECVSFRTVGLPDSLTTHYRISPIEETI
jgi:hypothetical protein